MRCWRQFLHLYGSQSSTVWCSDRGLCFLQLLLLVKKSSMQLICTLVVNELLGNWCGREITIIMTVAVTLRHDLMSFDGKKKIVKLFNKLFYDFFLRAQFRKFRLLTPLGFTWYVWKVIDLSHYVNITCFTPTWSYEKSLKFSKWWKVWASVIQQSRSNCICW